MQTITPHLWFNKEAVEAAEFYASCRKIKTREQRSDLFHGQL